MSGSMEPAIPVGAYVVVKKTEDANLKEGSIVAFLNPYDEYQTIVHRIAKIEKNGPVTAISTKGDNNKNGDLFTLSGNDIIGELVFTIPYLGYIAQFIRTPLGFFLFVGIPALIIIGLQIKKIKEGIQEEVMKKVDAHTGSKLVGIFLLFFALGAVILIVQNNVIYANFTSKASLQSISFSAIASPSPTPTPPLSKNGCNNVSIVIEGNGTGSENQVQITCSSSTIVIQVNNVLGVSTVQYESTYVANSGLQGVVGTIAVNGRPKVKGEIFFGSCSSDGCITYTNVKDKKLKVNLIQ